MTFESNLHPVLAEYAPPFQPTQVHDLGSAGGFSGARLWRLTAPRGELCLRRWPKEFPGRDRLEFIQAVLWHVDTEGFRRIPVPFETTTHAGYVRHDGHFWELAPWIPGRADYLACPSREKLQAALTALAQFHRAAATFPLPHPARSASPGIRQRLEQLTSLANGRLGQIARSIRPGVWPELESRAQQLIRLFPLAADGVAELLRDASNCQVRLQPCMRDIWSDHVLFLGTEVSGFVDFGATRADNVSADVARLLGSLAGDDAEVWHQGLAAYQSVRRLTPAELTLVTAFDKSSVLLSGLNWIQWVYLERRTFENREAILHRVDGSLARLSRLLNREKSVF